jgi:hypothetical protein
MTYLDLGSGFSLVDIARACATGVLYAVACAVALMVTDGLMQLAKGKP